MAEINVSSTWTCSDLLACFTLGKNENPSIMDDIVQADKSVCLRSKEKISENPCIIDISACINSNIAFKTLNIVSQCRLLELFGHHGEYLNTFHGDLFDEFEDTCIYVTTVKLKTPLNTLSIKFTRLKEHEFWIYGAYLTKLNLSTQLSHESFHHPRKQQHESSTVSMNTTLGQTPLTQFQNLLQTSSFQENSDLPFLLAQFLGSTSHMVSNKSAEIVHPTSEREEIEKPTSVENVSLKNIEQILKKELQNLEAKIFSQVNERFNQIEKKQDLILNKLDNVLIGLNVVNSEDKSNETLSYQLKNSKIENN